jgi:Uncharacterized protein conserved in bacteria
VVRWLQGDTQLALSECAAARNADAEATLSRRYQAMLRTESGASLQLFRRSQQEWLKYRETHCQWIASQFEGGTFQPLYYSLCLERVARARIRQLRADTADLGFDRGEFPRRDAHAERSLSAVPIHRVARCIHESSPDRSRNGCPLSGRSPNEEDEDVDDAEYENPIVASLAHDLDAVLQRTDARLCIFLAIGLAASQLLKYVPMSRVAEAAATVIAVVAIIGGIVFTIYSSVKGKRKVANRYGVVCSVCGFRPGINDIVHTADLSLCRRCGAALPVHLPTA